jgi:DNA-binding protein H-NS
MATAPELSEFTLKLAAMNARLQRQMETMKTDHAGQMDEMLQSFESRFNEMQERMEASHTDLRSLIITIQNTMHNTMENTTGTTRRKITPSGYINTPNERKTNKE